MKHRTLSCSLLFTATFLAVSGVAHAQNAPIELSAATWHSASAQHVYGFPGAKPHAKGALSLTASSLTFSTAAGVTSIARSELSAVSAGHQRVELWGVGGRILRMTIPDGGGIAAAAVMHHRIDMLTIEFRDNNGGMHGAVFFLPANEAERAMQSFAVTPSQPPPSSQAVCENGAIERNSVLVAAPEWDRAEVPAAYRALVYEHVVDRLRRATLAGYVYRDGETGGHHACPQYTVHIAIKGFKEGSSVKRAALGPAGFFVGTTQMVFDISVTDTSGKVSYSEVIKGTVRGESESTNVADSVAKRLAKRYAKAMKTGSRGRATQGPGLAA